MTEPSKLDDLKHQDQCRYWRHGDSCDCGADQLPEHLAIEQATADLRAELAAMTDHWYKARAERNEARAELARLTTLRPIASLPPNTQCLRWTQSRTGQHWMLVDKHDWHDFWTPLPPVKEADK
jgi:hypothetical protein